MAAVWMRVRRDLRTRWRGALALAILIGIGGGITMTAASGARRTSTSYERLMKTSRGYHAEIQVVGDVEDTVLEDVARLPHVAEYGRFSTFPATRAHPGKTPGPFEWDVAVGAIVDPALGKSFEIPRVSEGRIADFDEPLEGMVTEDFVRQWKIGVGDDFSIQLVTDVQMDDVFNARGPIPAGPAVTVRIVGTIRLPHDQSIFEPAGNLILTPAFYERYGIQAAHFALMWVRLRNGEADLTGFREEAVDLVGPLNLEIQPQGFFEVKVKRALDVQAVALWILAAVVAFGTALILGQAVGRWLTLGADDDPTLRALGMGSRSVVALSVIPAATIGVAAAAIGAFVAILASPAMPLGIARAIEPDPGVFVDTLVMAAGSTAVVGLVMIIGALQGMLLSRRVSKVASPARSRPSRAADLAAQGGMPPAVVTGVRLALEPGRGRTSVPVRSALAGATLSIIAVVAVFTFGHNLDRMFATPSTYGWNWDLIVFGGTDPADIAKVEGMLASSKVVESYARIRVGSIEFDGRDIQLSGIAPLRGTVQPTVLEGRFPTKPDEVALATKTLRNAGLRVGGRASFPGSKGECGARSCRAEFNVVGRTIAYGENADTDDGAAFAETALARIATTDGVSFTDFLVTTPPGVSRTAAYNTIKREFGDAALPALPPNLQNIRRVRTAPVMLASVLGFLGIATIAHVLVTSVRRRTRDVSILKTIGFVRRQVTATVAWQATCLAVVAAVAGVPIGLIAGRWAWRWLAGQLGVGTETGTPLLSFALGTIGLLVLANLVAYLPGRAAARTQPALVLRTE